jgi:hypothetical protein
MVIAIDSSLLLSYYDLKAGVPQSQTSTGSGSVSTSPPTQTTPWAKTPTATQTSLLVQSALDGGQLFNPSAVSLSVPATTANYGNTKQLFALYQGLTALQDIATQASGTSGFQLTQLQSAFANGMQQLQTYLNGSPFAGFRVAQGSVATSEQSSAGVPTETDAYTTNVLVSGDPTTPVPAFEGNVQFSMTVTLPSGNQTVVNFNLADMGSTPRSLANVINYLNGQLTAAGVFTQFADVLTQGTSTTTTVDGQTYTSPPGPNTYALQIVGNPIEQISLSAPTTSPAVYITQQAGASASNTLTGEPAATTGNTTTSGPTQQLLKLTTDPSATDAQVFSDTLGKAVQNAVATVTAPDGSVYVLANITGPTQTGQLTASHGISGQQDVALMKYDSAGNLVWTQTLGSTQSASGLGLAVSGDGSQIAIVGDGTGLSDNDGGPPTDTTDPTGFVQVYSSDGSALWSQSVDGWTAGQVSSVAFGGDGSVYVAGSTQVDGGPSDEFLAGFSPSGQPTFSTTLGLASSNGITGIAVDGSSLITAGDQNGQAVVQSYALQPSGAPTLSASETLGQADVAGLAVNTDGSIVVAGSTNNGALDPAATVASAYTSGSENAFVATLNASLTPSSSDTLDYLNEGADTNATAVTAAGGQVYIAGEVAAPPAPGSGALTGSDGFVAQIDPSTGAVTWSNTIDTDDNQSAPNSIAVDPSGASSLDALGLPSGTIPFTPSQDLTTNTGVQPGDQFTISSNFSPLPTTITIQATDTLQSLAQEIEQASGFAANVQVVTSNGVQQLEITPVSSSFQITLGAGPAGQNALTALGLAGGLITQNAGAKAQSAIGVNGARATTTLKANYGLGLESDLSVNSSLDIANALAQLGGAITTVKQVYSAMTTPPSVGASGPVPAYLTAEIASYQAALARLTDGASS